MKGRREQEGLQSESSKAFLLSFAVVSKSILRFPYLRCEACEVVLVAVVHASLLSYMELGREEALCQKQDASLRTPILSDAVKLSRLNICVCLFGSMFHAPMNPFQHG